MTITAKSLAEQLANLEYREEPAKELQEQAKAAGLVIVFGASDDLMEFRGAINDELDVYDGGTAYLTDEGLLRNRCDDEDCPNLAKEVAKARTIVAQWGKGEYSWSYKTDIPHETFQVFDDGEPYCLGIVFALADAKPVAQDDSTLEILMAENEELREQLTAAAALAAARIEQIPTNSKVVAVFTDLLPEHQEYAEAFAEAVKKRCTSGSWTLVAFFRPEASIQALDSAAMEAAGWVRKPAAEGAAE